MTDNVRLNPGATGELMATDEVAYSGDTAQVQLVRVVTVTGAEGSKVVGALDLASTVREEDTAHTSGDPGVHILAIRADTDAPTAGSDGDYTSLKCDEAGRLKVAVQPAGYPLVTGNITSASSSIPTNVSRVSNVMVYVSGTFAGVNFTFEGSLNSTNGTDGAWFGIQAVRSNANTIETTSGVLGAAPAYGWELSVNGLNWFRVRATAWTSGTAAIQIQPAAYATEPIPAAQISGTQPVSGTVGVTGYPTAAASADGLANPTVTKLDATNLLFNGTTWDRQRGNTSLSVEASSAKTANGNSAAAIVNHNARGVQLFVNVSASSGTTPTLVVRVQVQDPVGSGWVDLPGAATASITGNGLTLLTIYPGIAAVANSAINQPLPRNYRLAWVVGGTTPSFTFSVGAQYIL
jgi:hypothetical protein